MGTALDRDIDIERYRERDIEREGNNNEQP